MKFVVKHRYTILHYIMVLMSQYKAKWTTLHVCYLQGKDDFFEILEQVRKWTMFCLWGFSQFEKLWPLIINCATSWQNWHVRLAKTQISLGIRQVWSESSLCAQWVAKDPSFLHVDSEDSDQTGRMPRLIWVFAGCTCHFVGFVTGGSSITGGVCEDKCIKLTWKTW